MSIELSSSDQVGGTSTHLLPAVRPCSPFLASFEEHVNHIAMQTNATDSYEASNIHTIDGLARLAGWSCVRDSPAGPELAIKTSLSRQHTVAVRRRSKVSLATLVNETEQHRQPDHHLGHRLPVSISTSGLHLTASQRSPFESTERDSCPASPLTGMASQFVSMPRSATQSLCREKDMSSTTVASNHSRQTQFLWDQADFQVRMASSPSPQARSFLQRFQHGCKQAWLWAVQDRDPYMEEVHFDTISSSTDAPEHDSPDSSATMVGLSFSRKDGHTKGVSSFYEMMEQHAARTTLAAGPKPVSRSGKPGLPLQRSTTAPISSYSILRRSTDHRKKARKSEGCSPRSAEQSLDRPKHEHSNGISSIRGEPKHASSVSLKRAQSCFVRPSKRIKEELAPLHPCSPPAPPSSRSGIACYTTDERHK